MLIDLLNAMPDPSPAKTKINIEINSAKPAFKASAWPISAGDPIAILGIFVSMKLLVKLLFVAFNLSSDNRINEAIYSTFNVIVWNRNSRW